MREIAEEAEALGVEGGSQAFEEQATEQAGERRRMPRSCGDSITLRSFAPLP
jgi:hypothetical protein